MIRSATPEDESPLASLCRSVNRDDYVLDFLHRWITHDEVYVFERDSILGMIRLIYSRDGSAHLGAIRVHPDFRREGIGTELTRYCISRCGTKTVRLSIMDNPPSRALAEKLGFLPVAVFTLLMKREGIEASSPGGAAYGTPASVLPVLQQSPRFEENHQLLSSSFTFYHPSQIILDELQLLVCDENIAILDYEIDEAFSHAVQIAYCDPDPHLVRSVLWEAGRSHCEDIWAIIYKHSDLISLLEDHGFKKEEWAEIIRVYELSL